METPQEVGRIGGFHEGGELAGHPPLVRYFVDVEENPEGIDGDGIGCAFRLFRFGEEHNRTHRNKQKQHKYSGTFHWFTSFSMNGSLVSLLAEEQEVKGVTVLLLFRHRFGVTKE